MPQPRRPRKRPAGKPDEPHAIDITPEELGRLTPETLQRLKDEHGLEVRIRSTVAGVDELLGALDRDLGHELHFDKTDPDPDPDPYTRDIPPYDRDGFDRDGYDRNDYTRDVKFEPGEEISPEGP